MFVVKVPEDVKEFIKDNFSLKNGKVSKNKGTLSGCVKIQNTLYSLGYVKAVLENKDPDLSELFEQKDGEWFRTQDPVWAAFKEKRVTDKGAKVCGAHIVPPKAVSNLQMNSPQPNNPSSPQTVSNHVPQRSCEPMAPSEVEVPAHIERYIKCKFRLENGKVFMGDEEIICANIYGRRYATSYVKAVLENKKPNLELLFNIVDGERVRNADPVWGEYINAKAKKGSYSTCGYRVYADPSKESEQYSSYDWLKEVEEQPSGHYKYKDVEAIAHRINGVVYTSGYIDKLRAGRATKHHIPNSLFKKVMTDSGYVVLFGDIAWQGRAKLAEIRENKTYFFNDYPYKGADIINSVLEDKSTTWSMEKFVERAKELYPNTRVVGNIELWEITEEE